MVNNNLGIGECWQSSNHIATPLVQSDARTDKQFLFLIRHPPLYWYIVKYNKRIGSYSGNNAST
jgi:hypothetical protein